MKQNNPLLTSKGRPRPLRWKNAPVVPETYSVAPIFLPDVLYGISGQGVLKQVEAGTDSKETVISHPLLISEIVLDINHSQFMTLIWLTEASGVWNRMTVPVDVNVDYLAEYGIAVTAENRSEVQAYLRHLLKIHHGQFPVRHEDTPCDNAKLMRGTRAHKEEASQRRFMAMFGERLRPRTYERPQDC